MPTKPDRENLVSKGQDGKVPDDQMDGVSGVGGPGNKQPPQLSYGQLECELVPYADARTGKEPLGSIISVTCEYAVLVQIGQEDIPKSLLGSVARLRHGCVCCQ